MWGNIEKKLEAHAADALREGLAGETRSQDVPQVGTAHWDGESRNFTVAMTHDFYQSLLKAVEGKKA